MQAVSVSQLNNYIKSLVDSDNALYDVWVRGEISNFKRHTSGHMYLTLKDEQAVIRGVMFKSSNIYLKFNPESGMKVLVRGRVSVYPRDGQYQLYISEMQPDGVGALYTALEQLKQKLLAEGLAGHKKNLPLYPEVIGVITSPTGAAVRDILKVLSRRFKCANVVIYPVAVQGEKAAFEIVQAIEYFNKSSSKRPAADVLIVGRGGGSIEDLWAFNEEIVARAVAGSHIPVVSAVGHETDFTIIDMVSDCRAPTPSAAAEIVAPSNSQIKERIYFLENKLLACMNSILYSKRGLLDRQAVPGLMNRINQNRQTVDSLDNNLKKFMAAILKNNRLNFSHVCEKLNSLSPLGVLARGYSIIQDSNGKIIKSASQVCQNQSITARLSEGCIKCTVTEVE